MVRTAATEHLLTNQTWEFSSMIYDPIVFLFSSPVKFPGDCWPRCPSMPSSSTLQSPSEHAMDVSTVDQMEISASTEVTAPLPIRQPTGSAMGAFKQQAYPVMAKRPEHLRMNLWPVNYELEIYYNLLCFFYMNTRGKKTNSPPSQNLVCWSLTWWACALHWAQETASVPHIPKPQSMLFSDTLCLIRWIESWAFFWTIFFFFYMIVPSKEYETMNIEQ